ncbi:MAG: NAD(P)-binding protein, partial [Halieaceae bacterium]|nr:NAD(P)-binding protein [Halieaceae bacterium]
MPEQKKKIAILGGGIAGLSTAYFLTSQDDWQEHYDSITVYQMGWRLGGKCASSRNPTANYRIEEHGIHLFGGFYYNAFAMMKTVYEALGRTPGQDPLATIDEAFHANNASTMWESIHRCWRQWPSVQTASERRPWDDDLQLTPGQMLIGAFRTLLDLIINQLMESEQNALEKVLDGFGLHFSIHRRIVKALRRLEKRIEAVSHPDDLLPVLEDIKHVESWIEGQFGRLLQRDDGIRRALLVMDYMLTMFTGFIEDDVWNKGFDHLDEEDYKAWLQRHGANPETLNSPLPVMHPNILFAYLQGDASNPPTMGAGCFLHWSFLSFSEPGSYAWLFAAGTGETLIAPLYEVLHKRGVRFEFFHKVESLKIDGDTIGSIDIAVQATLRDGRTEYEPLFTDPDSGLIGWPHRPHYDQLAEGEALRAHDEAGRPGLESYWSDWAAVDSKRLHHGEDYDEVVMALSIGALPDTCAELIATNERWARMVEKVPAVQTQAFQVWLKEPMAGLAMKLPDKGTDVFIGANYMAPASAFADLGHLLRWEKWPADNSPGAILYFCGAMPENPSPPPYTDHDYPARQRERVKWQAAQLLQAAASPMMPKATVQYRNPACGDPAGFDFSL